MPAQAQATAPSVIYAGPLVITQGGTYSGNYRSTDSSVPVIKIQTTQPVIIENCILAGAGDLIDAKNGGASIIVRNNKGYGLMQSADNIRHGRFVEASSAKSVTIEHNYFESTSGITIYQWSGNGTAQQTLTVRYNSAKNIDGRYRNGGCYLSQFLQQNQVHNLFGCEIAWNQIINEPNKSLVEDNISFYNSGGSANSPDLLHDNYIQGAFPFPANATSYNGTGFIIDGDAVAANASAYVKAYRNQLVGTSGAGMNIAGGHDIQYYENRVINCGLLPDGSRVNSSWAAAAIWNAYGLPSTAFYNNSMSNNTIGYYHAGGNTPYPNRQDASPGACVNCTGTISLPNRPLTLADEQAEWTLWQQKLSQNGITVGPIGSSAPMGTTTPTTATPPTATLSTPPTGTVGTALVLTASAATASGTIAKVEFFNGATKLGEDLTSPYAFSYVPTAIGTLALTARATNSAGAATSSAPVNVTVSATTSTPTTTPGTATTPANATFFRAINLGGAATTIDGRAWEASTGAPNVTVNGSTFANQAITLNPATDAARASMIRSSAYNYSSPVSVAISGVASGTYSVYMYVWEDNNPETISLTLEGTTVKSNYNTGSAGHWERLGPFAASVTDGTINIGAVGSGANLSGVEIWRQTSGTTTTTPTTTTTTTPTSTGAQVTSFTLINADTDKDIQTIANGAVLNLAALPTRNLNIRANVAGAIGSVVFALSGAATQNQTESTAPYALFSDYQGNYNAWTPNVGSYSLTARPYSGGGGAGTLGTVTTIRFSVTSQAL